MTHKKLGQYGTKFEISTTTGEAFRNYYNTTTTNTNSKRLTFDQGLHHKDLQGALTEIRQAIQMVPGINQYNVSIYPSKETFILKDDVTTVHGAATGPSLVRVIVNVGGAVLFNQSSLRQVTKTTKKTTSNGESSQWQDPREFLDVAPIGVVNRPGQKGRTINQAQRAIRGKGNEISWVKGRPIARFGLSSNQGITLSPGQPEERYLIEASGKENRDGVIVVVDFRMNWDPEAMMNLLSEGGLELKLPGTTETPTITKPTPAVTINDL